MTDKEQPSVEVTQADHDLLNDLEPFAFSDRYEEGGMLETALPTIARHRTQSTAALRAQLAESEARERVLKEALEAANIELQVLHIASAISSMSDEDRALFNGVQLKEQPK